MSNSASPQSKKPEEVPTPSATPEERRKFAVLVVLAAIIIFLLWIATLPFALGSNENKTAGPRELFGIIGSQVSEGARIKEFYTTFEEQIQEEQQP